MRINIKYNDLINVGRRPTINNTLVKGLAALLYCTILLGSCSDSPTLEELRTEALTTGDWSQVESRERRLESKNRYRAWQLYCKEREAVLVCKGHGTIQFSERDCTCTALR